MKYNYTTFGCLGCLATISAAMAEICKIVEVKRDNVKQPNYELLKVPKGMIGLVIGKQGRRIMEIQNNTNTEIVAPLENHQDFKIFGTTENIEKAINQIKSVIERAPVMKPETVHTQESEKLITPTTQMKVKEPTKRFIINIGKDSDNESISTQGSGQSMKWESNYKIRGPQKLQPAERNTENANIEEWRRKQFELKTQNIQNIEAFQQQKSFPQYIISSEINAPDEIGEQGFRREIKLSQREQSPQQQYLPRHHYIPTQQYIQTPQFVPTQHLQEKYVPRNTALYGTQQGETNIEVPISAPAEGYAYQREQKVNTTFSRRQPILHTPQEYGEQDRDAQKKKKETPTLESMYGAIEEIQNVLKEMKKRTF